MRRTTSVFMNILSDEIAYLVGAKRAVGLLVLWLIGFTFLLGAIYSSEVVADLPFVVVDRDQTGFSRTIIRYLDSTRSFRYVGQVESVHEIEDLIRKDEIAFGLVIPAGTIGNIKRGKSGELRAFVNASNLMVANLAYSEIQTISGTLSAGIMIKVLRKTGEERDMALAHVAPVKMESYRLFNPNYNYRNYLGPGLWISVLHQILMLAGALVISREVRPGTLHRLLDRSKGMFLVSLVAKLTPYAFLALLLHSLWLFILVPLTGSSGQRNTPGIELATLLFVFSSLSVGLLISVLTLNVTNSLKAVLLIASPAFLISGYTWPLEGMPPLVQWLARCIPLTHYLAAFRKLFQQGADLSFVRRELFSLALIGSIALALSWVVFRFRVARRVMDEPGSIGE